MRNPIFHFYGKLDRLVIRGINRLRLFRFKLMGASIGKGVKMYGRVILVGDAANLSVGDGSSLNEGVILNLRNRIIIGQNVHVSANAQMHTAQLDLNNLDGSHESAAIVVEDGAWIACGAVITAGVRIGKTSVIGANSVVLNDVAPMMLVAGVPAKVIRTLSSTA